MTCEEFKNKVVELFDTTVDEQTRTACEAHIAQCPACKAYYDELSEAFRALRPQATPEFSTGEKPVRRHHGYWQVAAAVMIFVAGMAVGWSHLFSTPAAASVPPTFSLEQGIQCVQNVGSFEMNVYARTTPDENFAYFDPKADFVKVSMQLMRQGDSTFYRVEKENGRTVVCDGRYQYVWSPSGHFYDKNGLDANVLEYFSNLLYPERLLSMQKSAMELSKTNKMTRTETDSTIILMTEGTEVQALDSMKACKVTMENVFTKNDGLLRSVKIWMNTGATKQLIAHIDNIRYNLMLSKKALLSLPSVAADKWISVSQKQDVAQSRLAFLQKETPERAAQRVLQALTTGNTEPAKEALLYYRDCMGDLIASRKGCKATDFVARKKGHYPGWFVAYTLTKPDGKAVKEFVCVRNDNAQHIWLVDGGL